MHVPSDNEIIDYLQTYPKHAIQLLPSYAPNALSEAQLDYVVIRMVGNYTSHSFPLGSLAITAYSAAVDANHSYVYAFSPFGRIGQYLSSKCFHIVARVTGPDPVSYQSCMKSLYMFLTQIKDSTLPLDFYACVAKTQKARGLQVLSTLGFIRSHVHLLSGPIKPSVLKKNVPLPIMVRPCPITPRHGFVESRVAKTYKTINKVVTETHAADARGEVILMEPINGVYSAVLTDTAITMGKGTDGATSGKKCITIPCVSNLRYTVVSHGPWIYRHTKSGSRVRLDVLRYAGIRPHSGVYIETVNDQVVQLRTGPSVDCAATRYSTTRLVKAAFVYTVTGKEDFLAYEARLNELKHMYQTAPWTVVIVHRGASLASHYAVQAVTRGFSVVTDTNVTPEEVISFAPPKSGATVRPDAACRQLIIQALKVVHTKTPDHQLVTWAIAVIQGLAAANKTPQSLALLVAAGAILAKTGTALCIGEHRHYFRVGPGQHGYIASAPVSFPLTLEQHYKKGTLDRHMVYHEAFKLNWADMHIWQQMSGLLTNIEYDYRVPLWKSGYGGDKWAECTEATRAVVLAMIPFMLVTPTQPHTLTHSTMFMYQIQELIAACNRLITVSHNSAKCLTKIVTADTLDSISHGYTGLRIATSPLTWELLN